MIKLKDEGDGLFVVQVLINELHTLDIPELKDQINSAIEQNNISKMILDLKNVRVITSTGIGIFLSINHTLCSNFCLASPGDEVRKVLEMTKVNSIIKMFDSVEQAVEKNL